MDKIARVRQEIERNRQAIRVLNEHAAPEQMSKTCAIFQYSDSILSGLLSFLDTLSEEPASKGYDEAYLNEKIAKASKTWEGVDVDKYMDEVRGREPDKRLDVTDFCKPIDPGIAQCVADHWWEMLGDKEPDKSLEEAAKEYAEGPECTWVGTTALEEAFKAGAQWQKEQMLKDAEECELYWDGDFLAIDLDMRALGYSERDKVKVIVLKAEEK